MHAWVSSEAYEFEGEDIETVSFVLFKNDKLDLKLRYLQSIQLP